MKRIFSTLMALVILCTMLMPVAFAEETTGVVVSATDPTRIELEDYYSTYKVANSNASSGYMVRVQDTKINDEGVFVTSISLDVELAGEYDIEWVANAIYNTDSSPMTVAVNGDDALKVINASTQSPKDCRGNTVAKNDTSASTDAGYTVPVTIGGNARDYVMKKYSGKVNLTEGVNTIEIYVAKGMNWSTSNFVMDYVELAPKCADVSATATTRIELENYYDYTADIEGASNGIVARVQDTKLNDEGVFVTNVYLDVDKAGEYKIEWVANAINNSDSSPMTLAVNGTDALKVSNATTGTIKDGRGNVLTANDTTASTDAGFAVPVAIGGTSRDYAMKKYSGKVTLTEGLNTVELYVAKGMNWATSNFVMDYVEFTPPTCINLPDRQTTRVEVDQFYGAAGAVSWSNSTTAHDKASGGYYTLFYSPGGGKKSMLDYYEQGFFVNAEVAGEYTVGFVAGPQSHGNGKGKVEVLVNDNVIIDTTDTTNATDPTPGENVPAYNNYIVDMWLYTATVYLDEGINTIVFKSTGSTPYDALAFAADYIEFTAPECIDISTEQATRIELDQFYNVGGASNWTHSTNSDDRASGGAYTLFCNGNGSGVNTDYAEVRFDVYVSEAEEYTVDFVAGPQTHGGWNSRVELLVNGTEIIDTVDTAYISDPTPDEDFPSGTNTANISYNFDMKLYQATINLPEGRNTITIKVAGANYNKLCFAVDYIEFALAPEVDPRIDYATLDVSTNTATAKVYYDTTYTGTVIIAVYDADSRLIGVNKAPISADYAEISAVYNGIADNVKVMVWDDLTTCVPLAKVKTPAIQ